MVKGMRETAIEDFKKAIDNCQRYTEGQKDGFEKGYDRAMQDMQGILKKYHVGVEKPRMAEEKELKPAIRFLGGSMKSLIDKIVEECKKMRTLDPVCLSFICNISHTNEEEYRCYHFRQYNPTLWNS